MTEKLSPDFLNELFKTCLRNRTILEIAIEHIQYHFLPTEHYKEIWKATTNHFRTLEDMPSIGVLSEQFKTKPDIIEQLRHIKEADVPNREIVLNQLEIFVKKAMFLELHQDMKDTYEKGQHDKAFDLLQKKAEGISNFSLKGKTFESIYSNFEERYRQRMMNNAVRQNTATEKACWGIDPLDKRHYGGVNKKDTALITARSNVGKSPALKHIGYVNSRMGKNVLHVQVEGSEEECKSSYDAMMGATTLHDMELTSLPEQTVKKIIEASKKVSGEIFVIAYEKFGGVTMVDVRNSITDFLKIHNKLDVLILDYIDKVQPGDGRKYSTNTDGEKARRGALGDIFKNLCMEYNLSGFTATQASDVKQEIWNNPAKVITRSDVMGDKTFITPFSYHITLNQTTDEKKNEIMRLYEDKSRKYGYGYTHYISTAYKNSRFYDKQRTMNMFVDK